MAEAKTSSNYEFDYGLKSTTLDLSGKVLIVTGASSGMGRITAKRLASQGATVVLTARRKANVEVAAKEIVASGGEALAVASDITNAESIDSLVKEVIAKYGKVSGAFLNSGTLSSDLGPLNEVDDLNAAINATFAVNVTGAANSLKYVANAIKATSPEGGSIVYTSSLIHGATPVNAIYSASKAAGEVLFFSAAAQLKKEKIRVNVVRPGFTLPSDMLGAYGTVEQILKMNGPKYNGSDRPVHAEEIANVVSFFLSDSSLSITGVGIDVSCGHQNSTGFW